MNQGRNSGIGCIIGLLMMVLFGSFIFFNFTGHFFILPIFPMIIVFIIFICIAIGVSVSAKSNRNRPAGYYYQKYYDNTNPYVASNSANLTPQPKIIKNNNSNQNLKPQSQDYRENSASIAQGASFCQNCGNRLNTPDIKYSHQFEVIDNKRSKENLLDKSFCPYCGTKTDKDAIYCFHCGTKLIY